MSLRLRCCTVLVCIGLLVSSLPVLALTPPGSEPFAPGTQPIAPNEHAMKSLVPAKQHIDTGKTKFFLARLLGWTRDYEGSLNLYQELLRTYPDWDQARREAARTAYWAKKNELGDRLYQELFTPTVDTLLARELETAASREGSKALSQRLREYIPPDPESTVFTGYEILRQTQSQASATGPLPAKLQTIRRQLRAEYVFQKRVWLEYKAKQAMWNKRFIRAKRRLQKLVQLEPENREAWFDFAQSQCALGLCGQEAETYRQLLAIDPKHNLAQRALERQKTRSKPAIQARYSAWREKGRGNLARMGRQQADIRVDVPVACQHGVTLTHSRFWENPDYGPSSTAQGLGVQARLRPNAFWSATLAARFKDYLDGAYEDQSTGEFGLRFNAWDLAHVDFQYARENVLPNGYALEQGIQKDRWRAELAPIITHSLSGHVGAEYSDYNDQNAGSRLDAALGYVLTDHPRQLEVTLSGEYRDTQHASQETPQNITHPYWTPQNYLGTAVTLHWQHDLSRFQFCGSRKNIYDLQLTFGTDSDSNPSLALKGKYKLDFKDHWGLELEGMIHESQNWDARSLQMSLTYSF
ncbi:hypothetical protein Dret_1519 [Desulfohalobium retbaense DSM 5692]|uniref:Tetratricopeptide repeat protein n=2 Tax=Desulfohalobium TaxID=45662 RepID=C8X308_DESRD|nr:hypothetical protein Dret_1519 [Desulfohalobium retbaense DSM 5692]